MSKLEMLRELVDQRLTAAVEEIFELFEKTIEYKEEFSRSEEKNDRLHRQLKALFNPEVRLHRTGLYMFCVFYVVLLFFITKLRSL
ncbi:hypothetical protein LDENG_00054240 [Lucifuga dentata]|nr:hypothetical protein LDENG_00054240 [Lucifuga dentata]